MKRFLKIIFWVFISLTVIFFLLSLNAGTKPEKIAYGVTFSKTYAEGLGLDWKKAYEASLTDLNIKLLRLPAYWDDIEKNRGEFNFEDLDYEVNEAAKHNATIILAIGRRLPRWPECHDPSWLSGLSQDEQDAALLSMLETVVQRYNTNTVITTWQVENEPFLSSFGICPKPRPELLDTEIALVKKLDPVRPVLITDSGELNWWFKATARGDVFGTTFYRYVFSDVLKRYWTNFYFFPWVYRVKGGIIHLVHPDKPILVSELEAEPWTTQGIPNTPIDQQFKTMSMDHFNTIIRLARKTGYSPQYLWGVEWWYWMKQKDHPEFWERAKKLMNN